MTTLTNAFVAATTVGVLCFVAYGASKSLDGGNGAPVVHMCKAHEWSAWRGDRPVLTHMTATPHDCAALCSEQSMCSYAQHDADTSFCRMYATPQKRVASGPGHVAYDCSWMCRGADLGVKPSFFAVPPACHVAHGSQGVWDGGAPDVINERMEGVTAACTARASSAVRCAEMCAAHADCRSFNYREADHSCYRLKVRMGKEVDALGDATGGCDATLQVKRPSA